MKQWLEQCIGGMLFGAVLGAMGGLGWATVSMWMREGDK